MEAIYVILLSRTRADFIPLKTVVGICTISSNIPKISILLSRNVGYISH